VKLFSRHRKAIEPLNAEFSGEPPEAAEQDNTPGTDDQTFEEIERHEAKKSRHGGIANFGR
jgi:hypothetical protein